MHHLSLKENAYKLIKGKILNDEFECGARIREDLLAEEISMSRTPVREAINQLSAEGFVKNIPRKGTYLVELNTDEILDMIDVRESLEILAVERCIDKIKPEQLQCLTDIHNEFHFLLSEGRYNECNELDSRFHREIAAISENQKLIGFLEEIENFMSITRTLEKKASPEIKNKLTLEEHLSILTYIRSKDKANAVKAIKENIETMKKNLGL